MAGNMVRNVIRPVTGTVVVAVIIVSVVVAAKGGPNQLAIGKAFLLGGLIETGCPVRILQGVEDPDVPWQHAVELTSRLASDDVVLTLVKDGDHRLSRPEDTERMIAAVKEF